MLNFYRLAPNRQQPASPLNNSLRYSKKNDRTPIDYKRYFLTGSYTYLKFVVRALREQWISISMDQDRWFEPPLFKYLTTACVILLACTRFSGPQQKRKLDCIKHQQNNRYRYGVRARSESTKRFFPHKANKCWHIHSRSKWTGFSKTYLVTAPDKPLSAKSHTLLSHFWNVGRIKKPSLITLTNDYLKFYSAPFNSTIVVLQFVVLIYIISIADIGAVWDRFTFGWSKVSFPLNLGIHRRWLENNGIL